MPKIRYKNLKLSPAKLNLIGNAQQIIRDWQAQGYKLTLRQLYYRFIALDLFPESWIDKKTGSKNVQSNYKKLGKVMGDARVAGIIDWWALEDRTRNLMGNPHNYNPQEVIEEASKRFQLDKWAGQKNRVECWVEKDALEGIIGVSAARLDVDYFSCRGYTSLTSIWDAGQRLKQYAMSGQSPVVLHFGDHDPSGIDMSRDIRKRVKLFMDGYGDTLIFERLALNMSQVKKYKPPPNPVKVTDSRHKKYIELHGNECWELDALEPSVIDDLIKHHVGKYRDEKKYNVLVKEENEHREHLKLAADNWDKKVTPMLKRIKLKKRK